MLFHVIAAIALLQLELGCSGGSGGGTPPPEPASITLATPTLTPSAVDYGGATTLTARLATKRNCANASASATYNGTELASGPIDTGLDYRVDIPSATTSGTVTVNATCGGARDTRSAELTVRPTTLTITDALAEPASPLTGDTVTFTARAQANAGTPTMGVTYNSTTSEGASPYTTKREARQAGNATVTARAPGAQDVTVTVPVTYRDLTVSANARGSTTLGQSATIDFTTAADADSVAANFSDGRRIVTGTRSIAVPLTATGPLTATPIAYNGAATRTGTPVMIAVTAPPANVRLRALDVETHPSLRATPPALRYSLAIDGTPVSLPADTTISIPHGARITVPTQNTIEPLVGLYENGRMVGALDAFTNTYTNRGGDRTIDVDVMLRDKLTPEQRQAGLFIYTDIFVNVGTGELVLDKGTIRPIAHERLNYWVQRTPKNGICQAMPADRLANFYEAANQIREWEKDQFGRSLVTFDVKTEDFPDSLWVQRTGLPNSEPTSFGPKAGNVLNCYESGAALQSTYYGTNGMLDAFFTNNGSGESSVAELIDLTGRVYRGREWPRNNGLSIFEKNPIVSTYTALDKRWRAGPTRIATEAARTLGTLLTLPKNPP